MKFLDRAKIFIKAGNGGSGTVSFRREKYIPRGGPDGGNGGNGGDVWIKTNPNINTLIDFRYKQHYIAENGNPGAGSNKYGRRGKDLVLEVPIGTQIYNESQESILFDLEHPSQSVLLLEGGRGGKGNHTFVSSTNQAPRQHTIGQKGEEAWLWLIYKLRSDMAFISYTSNKDQVRIYQQLTQRIIPTNYLNKRLYPLLTVVYNDRYEALCVNIPSLCSPYGAYEIRHIEFTKMILCYLNVLDDQFSVLDQMQHIKKMIHSTLIHQPLIIITEFTDYPEKISLHKYIDALPNPVTYFSLDLDHSSTFFKSLIDQVNTL